MSDYQVTFRGDYGERDDWRAAWEKLIVRARCLDSVPVLLNDKKIEMLAELDDTEIRLRFNSGPADFGPIQRVGIFADRKMVFGARLHSPVTLRKFDDLLIVVLKVPNDIERAAVAAKSYRGDSMIMRKDFGY